ncbi:hypothetical protein GJ496_009131 [Pomphorhynchus laevis]|nr:hypothetical protein GJ496_009131 [Pomphorhynchus laevis]
MSTYSNDRLLRKLFDMFIPTGTNTDTSGLWTRCLEILNSNKDVNKNDADCLTTVRNLIKSGRMSSSAEEARRITYLISKLRSSHEPIIQFLILIRKQNGNNSAIRPEKITTNSTRLERVYPTRPPVVKRDNLDHKITDTLRDDANSVQSYNSAGLSQRTAELKQSIWLEFVFAMQGISGKNFDVSADHVEIKGLNEIERCTRMKLLRFLELGKLFCLLYEGSWQPKESDQCFRGFISYIRQELNEYRCLMSAIEQQFKEKNKCNLHACLWESVNRLRYLAALFEGCKGKQSGRLLSTIYNFLQQGNVIHADIGNRALLFASTPIFYNLKEWLLSGNLLNGSAQFFIDENKHCDKNDFWTSRYFVRYDLLPSFISDDQSTKVLFIGKALNFIRIHCNDTDVYQVRHETLPKVSSMYSQDDNTEFAQFLNQLYKEAGSQILNLMFKKYHLLDHFAAIRDYLFLAKGDFVRYLMDDV